MSNKSVWETYIEMCDHIAVIRPDLAAEAQSFGSKPPADFSNFLNEHFPIPDGWAKQPVEYAPRILRENYPE